MLSVQVGHFSLSDRPRQEGYKMVRGSRINRSNDERGAVSKFKCYTHMICLFAYKKTKKTRPLFSLHVQTTSFPLFKPRVCYAVLSCLCVHAAPVSSPISQYVNTRLKLRGSKGQSPLRFPLYLFILLEAFLKRIILEMSRPGRFIDLRDVENCLAVTDV